MTPPETARIRQEFSGAQLGDERLNRRLTAIAESVAARPAESFPEVFQDPSQLEGLYRFVNNTRVTASKILAPHCRETVQRAAEHATVWVAHDTTFCTFDGEGRVGLGPLAGKNGAQGFLAHVALAMAPGERVVVPLGVLGLKTWVRPHTPKGKRSAAETRADPDNEYHRWDELAAQASQALGDGTRVVHVMDREADVYDLFAQIGARGDGFVIRLSDDRCTTTAKPGSRRFVKLSDVLEGMRGTAMREVCLSARKGRKRGVNPARDRRMAELHFAAQTVELRRPDSASSDSPEAFVANLIHVWEVDPPEGESAVQWKLLTSEPVESTAQLLQVVDAYRARWLIEELFKALKTGCAFEKRQLETYEALVRTLALLLPMAWQMLSLRALSRDAPDAPATQVLNPTQVVVLRHFSKRPLPQNPTAAQALYAIAALGGHLKQNGPPGWLVLGRGFETLRAYEAGWLARDAAPVP